MIQNIFQISWRRAEEKTSLTTGTMTFVDDPRFEVAHIDESDDWNLMISNVTTVDTGAYKCQISATDRELRKEVYSHVKGVCYTLYQKLICLYSFSLLIYPAKSFAHFGIQLNSVLTRVVAFSIIYRCLHKAFCNTWMIFKLKSNVPLRNCCI